MNTSLLRATAPPIPVSGPAPGYFPGASWLRRCKPGRYHHPYSQSGWTLPELLATCAIALILVAAAVPSFRNWQQRSAETIALSTLGHAADFARLHAIRDHQYTTVCASVDGSHCDGKWRDRIAVFSDHNRNEIIDAEDRLLRIFDLPETVPCIRWQASAGRSYLQFKPNGSSNGTAGHFQLCQQLPGQTGKKLVVSLNGRTALRKQ